MCCELHHNSRAQQPTTRDLHRRIAYQHALNMCTLAELDCELYACRRPRAAGSDQGQMAYRAGRQQRRRRMTRAAHSRLAAHRFGADCSPRSQVRSPMSRRRSLRASGPRMLPEPHLQIARPFPSRRAALTPSSTPSASAAARIRWRRCGRCHGCEPAADRGVSASRTRRRLLPCAAHLWQRRSMWRRSACGV